MSGVSSVHEIGEIFANIIKTAAEDGLTLQEFEEQESFLMGKLRSIELSTTRKSELR